MSKVLRMQLRDQALSILNPLDAYARQCHAASIKLVNAGVGTRVARGTCPGVGSQHSWAVVGDDCYEPEFIIDPTLWSYLEEVDSIFVGSPSVHGHRPHGDGFIWDWGQPVSQGGVTLRLNPNLKLSGEAAAFLSMLGDLDVGGWMMLASRAPVGGWPAREIIEAMLETPELEKLVPIDRIGMLTDRNPSGLYLPGGPRECLKTDTAQ